MEAPSLRRDAPLSDQVVVGDHVVRVHPEHGMVIDRAPAGARPTPRPRPIPRTMLPHDMAGLLGRDDEVRVVRSVVESGAPVEVVGEAGIGKTSFLRHLANRHRGSGGVVVAWAQRQPGEDILQLLFECFYECDGTVVPTATEMERYLEDRSALVVLDDVDLARRELERVMSLAPRCVFAIGAGERRLWGGGRSIALKGLDQGSCIAIAERELKRGLTEHERASLGRLAAALEGHPLRILQAAHLMIQPRRARSGSAAPSGSPSAQFDELVAQSLDADEERVLSPLAAFPGVCLEARRLAEITSVPDAYRALASLERRGLVRRHGPSYSLVGTAHAALARRVDPAVWRNRALEQHSRAGEDLSTVEAPTILALLDAGAEAGNLRAVIQLARNADAALVLGARWGAWREAIDRALVAARELRDQRDEAWALHQLGSRAASLGDLHGGTALLNNALHLRHSVGDAEGARLTSQNLEALRVDSPAPSAAIVAPPASGPAAPVPPAPTPPPESAAPPEPAPPPAPPPPAPPPPTAPARPRAAPSEPPRRWKPTVPKPPLKPVIGVLGAILVVGAIVLLLSGGDEDSSDPKETNQKQAAAKPRPADRRAGRARKRKGRRRPPAIAAVIGPKALKFTAPEVRLSKPRDVLATNRGGARITLGRVRLEGKDEGDFVATDGCNRTVLSRGESCKVVVSFIPAKKTGGNSRSRNAFLVFTNDGKGGRPRVPLTGSVTAP